MQITELTFHINNISKCLGIVLLFICKDTISSIQNSHQVLYFLTSILSTNHPTSICHSEHFTISTNTYSLLCIPQQTNDPSIKPPRNPQHLLNGGMSLFMPSDNLFKQTRSGHSKQLWAELHNIYKYLLSPVTHHKYAIAKERYETFSRALIVHLVKDTTIS